MVAAPTGSHRRDGFDAVTPASTVSPGAAVTSASLAAVEPSTSAAVRRQDECPGDEEVSAKKAKRDQYQATRETEKNDRGERHKRGRS